MNEQMPIMDGYRATHIIRTEQPFRSLADIRNTPIVAMTASAIQGDKEKCQNAGMDDYLSKPVKGKLLEKMLVKWAIESKRLQKLDQKKQAGGRGTPGHSPDSIATAQPQSPVTGIKGTQVEDPHDSLKTAKSLQKEMHRINHENATTLSKSSESSNDRSQRRAAAEEKASSLRDDKLVSSGDDPRGQRVGDNEAKKATIREGSLRQPLTQANMQKLAGEHGEALQWKNLPQNSMSSASHSPLRSRSYDNTILRGKASRPSLKAMRGHRTEWNVNSQIRRGEE